MSTAGAIEDMARALYTGCSLSVKFLDDAFSSHVYVSRSPWEGCYEFS